MHITTTDNTNHYMRQLILDDGTRVSRLKIYDLEMRIGSIPVTVAGIGDVYTHWQYRNMGYMRHLYEDTVSYMTNQGYCVSILFGIDNFYSKWGYATCLADYRGKVKVRDAERATDFSLGVKMRKVDSADMDAIVSLYNEYNVTRTGSIVRSPDTFTKFNNWTDWGTTTEPILWEDEHRNLIAYAVLEKGSEAVKILEIATLRNDIFANILYYLAEQGIEKRCETITIHLPTDHPFAEYAQRFGAVWEVKYPRNGSGMMRIINQQRLFTELEPELEQRIGRSPIGDYTGVLTIKTELDSTHLHIKKGHVEIIDDDNSTLILNCRQDQLMQILLGYRSVQDVLNDKTVQTKGNVIPILEVLFPKGVPFMYVADHF